MKEIVGANLFDINKFLAENVSLSDESIKATSYLYIILI